ncbi:MAG: beta-galactosidase [Chloroflexota bacterium]|nr:beta-galactosidase [Chloroflexota bacterium]
MPAYFPATLLYGADYNPEQWPEPVWLDDMRLMKLASVNMVSLNIFSWALLEPEPGQYHFEQLDHVMAMLAEHAIVADLATATASPPTWMSRLYPTMLPITRDGKRLYHGARQHYCPNSPDYRRASAELVRRLAERYRAHPTLAMWHVNNEYGCHTPRCFCENCAIAFRAWLQERYQSLDDLNFAWSTNFWSQRYYHWEDILPPRIAPAQNNPGQSLDYQRFQSDSLLACYLNEARILREVTPAVPITTNLMVAFKPLDYFAWAPHLDIISFDNYPPPTMPPWEMALTHDLMRSLKGGQPHLVMEQTPGQVNWMEQNPHKRPGRLRLQSLQSVAHGADGVLYFQWRQSQAGAEKFHSAVVPHEGSEHGRIFREVAQVGAELKRIAPDVAGSRIPARVAILLDWQNWWAVEYLPGPSNRLCYWGQIKACYRALHGLNVAVDVVSPSSDLSGYRLVVAPLLHLLRPGVAQSLEQFVERGGTLLITFFSGIVDQNDHVAPGGYPGELRKLLGIHVEEFDPWTDAMSNEVVVAEGPLQGTYPCTLWGEVVHLEGARALGVFASDYYAGGPALTAHQFGQGHVYYLATQGSEVLLAGLLRQLCLEASISSLLEVSEGVEVTMRVRADARPVYFLLNHSDRPAQVTLPAGTFTSLLDGREIGGQVELAARDVVVLLG